MIRVIRGWLLEKERHDGNERSLVGRSRAGVAASTPAEATYRLQFHKGFTFRDALAIVPYLHDLGVSHCYASPYLQSRPGSMHGYDITNHQKLNAEIGTEEEYDAWVAALRATAWVTSSTRCPTTWASSATRIRGGTTYWRTAPLRPTPRISTSLGSRRRGRNCAIGSCVPILGDPYGQALESQQIRLNYADGAFTIHYFDNRLPIAPCSYGMILSQRTDELKAALGEDAPPMLEYLSILNAVSHLPGRTEIDPAQDRRTAAREGSRQATPGDSDGGE